MATKPPTSHDCVAYQPEISSNLPGQSPGIPWSNHIPGGCILSLRVIQKNDVLQAGAPQSQKKTIKQSSCTMLQSPSNHHLITI